jgi:hypothetical protein
MIAAAPGVAESTGATTAWFTLAGALGGVLLTSLVGLAGAILNRRWQTQNAGQQLLQEHHKQLRQERRETFVRYWAEWNRFNYQLRALRDAVTEAQDLDNPPASVKKYLEDRTPELVEATRAAEMDWREAADAIFLIATPAVTSAAARHVELTAQKITAAWEGRWVSDAKLGTARELNDTMRNDLISPTPP